MTKRTNFYLKYILIVLGFCFFFSFFHHLTQYTDNNEIIDKLSETVRLVDEILDISNSSAIPTESTKIESVLWPINEQLIPNSTGTNTDDEVIKFVIEKQNLATSGKTFQGERTRIFPKNELKFRGKTSGKFFESEINLIEEARRENKLGCEKWGVVTTIFEPPSEAVRRFMYRKDWCVVIVGDKGKPSKVSVFFTRRQRSKPNTITIIGNKITKNI